jgi:hypothetical protein
MPVLVSRAPLEPLSNMASINGASGASKRKPTRHVFLDEGEVGFDDDTRAKKKVKADDGAATIVNRGRTNGAAKSKNGRFWHLRICLHERDANVFMNSLQRAK